MNNKIEYEPIKPILKKPLEIEAELLASEVELLESKVIMLEANVRFYKVESEEWERVAELLASEKGNLPTPLEELHKRLMDNYALSRKPNRYEDAIDMLNEGNL